MADPIMQQGVSQAFKQNVAQNISEGVKPANLDAQEQFQNAMNSQKTEKLAQEHMPLDSTDTTHKVNASSQAHVNEVNVTDSVNNTEAVKPLQKTSGDNVLDAMQREMTQGKAALETSLNAMEGSTGDMMRLQYQIAQATMTQSVVGQVGSKTGQGVQQLLKGQG